MNTLKGKTGIVVAVVVVAMGLVYLVKKKTSSASVANPDYNLSNEIIVPSAMSSAGGSVGSFPLTPNTSPQAASGIGLGLLLVGTPNGPNFTQIGPGLALSESYNAGNQTFTPYEPLGLPSAQPTILGV